MPQSLAQYENDVLEYFSALPTSSFEEGHCPFIHSNPPEHLDLFAKGSMTVSRCECGFIYNRTQPTQVTLDEFYSKSKAMDKWSEIKGTEKEDIRQIQKFGWVVDHLVNLKVNSVLDIGCGTGKFLSMLHRYQPQTRLVGVDQNSGALPTGKGIEFVNDSIFNFLDKTDEKFDAITMWGVLEHVKDPVGLLKKVSARLTGPKIVVTCVPNVESEIVQRSWEKCFTFQPTHLWYFSRQTLERAYYESGLTVKTCYTIEPESIPVIKHSKGLDPYRPLPTWASEQLLSKSVIDHLDFTLIEKGMGYKLVAIGVPR